MSGPAPAPTVVLGVTLGDVTGVGPEVAARAVAALPDADPTRCVVFGSRQAWARAATMAGIDPEPPAWDGGRRFAGRVALADGHVALPPDAGPSDARVGAAALTWLESGARACVAGALDGLVTAPLSKASVARAGHPGFTGQTEHLAALAGVRRFAMMLLGHDDAGRWLRVVLATTHLPLSRVAGALTPDAVQAAIEMASEACRQLGLPRRRVGVCGLNPHAGEEGLLGDEESRVIRPAIARCRASGIDVEGPFAADTLFHRALHGAHDAVVAQYHDQGLAPLKLVAFDNGVNWTVGLPWPRTSPDHGTAHDIAWKGVPFPCNPVMPWPGGWPWPPGMPPGETRPGRCLPTLSVFPRTSWRARCWERDRPRPPRHARALRDRSNPRIPSPCHRQLREARRPEGARSRGWEHGPRRGTVDRRGGARTGACE